MSDDRTPSPLVWASDDDEDRAIQYVMQPRLICSDRTPRRFRWTRPQDRDLWDEAPTLHKDR